MKHIKLFLLCLALAAVGHAVFFYQWANDHFMAGINDGLSQMMVFKQLLYDQYTSGEFFYSFSFGLGAGTYSGLSYYFSTSFVFIITAVFFFLLESAGVMPAPDVLFWAQAAVFISTIRLAFVLFITVRVFRYMKLSWTASVVGASIYGLSGMFFRHTVYWEFFADAYLWLPLLIFGVEKIFRERAPGWFLAAVAISLIDNFYFAYINFLLAGLYILVRLFLPLAREEIARKRALLLFSGMGLLGFGISAFSFVPAVYAYLNNHRPPFEQDIAWFELSDNVLFTSRYIILPAVFVIFLFVAAFYRNRTFRLFAVLGVIGVVLHFSPMAASMFNGFSAPQYRWEYFLAFVMGGAVAAALDQLHRISVRQLAFAVFATACWYTGFLSVDPTIRWGDSASYPALIGLAFTVIALALFAFYRKAWIKQGLVAGTIAWLLVSVNLYEVNWLLDRGNISEVNLEMATSAGFDDPEVRSLIEEIQERDSGETYRIDWMEGVRNNTPIVQDFRGLSAYSSILNKNLLYFYLYDLEIDMGRESVSRYATLGNRTNLHSMLQGTYKILPDGDLNIPYGFEEVLSSANYTVYENQLELPFVRGASTVFTEQQLDSEPALVREHAMLSGIVLDEASGGSAPPSSDGVDTPFQIEENGADYSGGTLTVTEERGGIDLVMDEGEDLEGDLYVSFHLVNTAADQGFTLAVNDYSTSRKSNASVYKTHVDDLTIRVPAAETVEIRLPEGVYELNDLAVSFESYEVLQEAVQQPDGLVSLDLDGSRVEITYDNGAEDDFAKIAIPYERGWQAAVNGEKADLLKADYAFLAVPVEAGENDIVLTYRPPFFTASLIVSLLSLAGSIFIIRRLHKRSAPSR